MTLKAVASGGGGGSVSGSGTPGTLPIWSGATALGNSPLSFSGSTLASSAAMTGINFSAAAAGQTWTLPNNAFALAIQGTSGNATLKLDTNIRYVGVDSPSSPADKLHLAESGALALRMQNTVSGTYWQHKVDASGNWGLAVNGGTNAMTAIASTGNVAIGTTASATANSRLTVAGGFIVPAAGFGVYQAGDHLTLQAGAGKNVHLRPNDGGVLAVNVGSATCDMSAVAGYVLAVGGPVRATATSATAPAFSTPGDTNTGIYFPAADTLRFATAGSPAMSLTPAQVLQFDSGFGSVANAYGCRAWVNFNGTGVIAIRASGNVSSITDAAVGQYVVNFTSAMPDVNYAAIGTKQNAATNADVSFYDCFNAVASLPARTVNASGWQCLEGSAYVDSTNVNVAYFR